MEINLFGALLLTLILIRDSGEIGLLDIIIVLSAAINWYIYLT